MVYQTELGLVETLPPVEVASLPRSALLFQEAKAEAFKARKKQEISRFFRKGKKFIDSKVLPSPAPSAHSPKPADIPPATATSPEVGTSAVAKSQTGWVTPTPPSSGISPIKRSALLRQRSKEIERLCECALGRGMESGSTPEIYCKLLLKTDSDSDLMHTLNSWLSQPLRKPWHFHVSVRTGRLFCVHDQLGIAISEHPDHKLMERVVEFSREARTFPGDVLHLLIATGQRVRLLAENARKFLIPEWKEWAGFHPYSAGTAEVQNSEIFIEKKIEKQNANLSLNDFLNAPLPNSNRKPYYQPHTPTDLEISSIRRKAAIDEIDAQAATLLARMQQFVARMGVPRCSDESVSKLSSKARMQKAVKAMMNAARLIETRKHDNFWATITVPPLSTLNSKKH